MTADPMETASPSTQYRAAVNVTRLLRTSLEGTGRRPLRNCIESALLEGAPNPAPRLIEIVGPHPGPCVALLGGIHGDEDEGVLSVRRVIAMLRDRPIAGTVRAVAASNPVACEAYTRCTPGDAFNYPQFG
jgi:Succinylglutamate desuccinylase / Aspartoacylase family